MLTAAVQAFLSEHRIERCGLLVAVSGGYDSTALLLLLSDSGEFQLTCGHINHHLRGDESDGDEQYVHELCERLHVPLVVADGTLDPEQVHEMGVEAAAREVRIARLQEIRAQVNARYIATAHQKNDQAETVLMRLFTGSGLSGLRGVHPIRDDGIIRPLLGVTRAEIEAFLRERGETPRADRMNSDPRFLRTRVRRTLSEYEPWVIENLAALADAARERWPEVERAIDAAEDVEITDSETRFRSLPPEKSLRRALLYRHIRRLDPEARDVSRADLQRIEGELDSLTRVRVTKRVELVRERAGEAAGAPLSDLVLRRIPLPASAFEYGLRAGETIAIPEIGATLGVGDAGAQPFMLPQGSDATFTVRNRRDGDRFHPLGAPGSKKLKDFLIDRKIPLEKRDRIPLLVWHGEIVWVAGVEISERFKQPDGGGDLYAATFDYS
jgi:tRNA(Ile)-lysidine synthase